MTTPDELERAVERLKRAARNNNGSLIDDDYGEVFVCVSDLHLANKMLSERAELLATVERMRPLLRECLGDYGHKNFTDRHGMADRIRAALTTGEEK